MALDPTLKAALEGPSALVFLALQIDFPGMTLRLLDGSGELTIGGEVFAGDDPDLGGLQMVEPMSDGIGADAPSLRVVINPPSNTAAATLAAAAAQGSLVSLWVGVADPQTMTVVGEPFLLFSGEVDQGVLRIGGNARAVALECVSAFERFFDDDEGVRLTDAWHQSIWPGELGLEFITETDRQLPWGVDSPTPGVVTRAGTSQVAAGVDPMNIAQF